MKMLMNNNLKNLREKAGLTQLEAAEAMGMSKSGYVKLERADRGLKQDHLRRAAIAFGCEPGEIIAGESALSPLNAVEMSERTLTLVETFLQQVGHSESDLAAMRKVIRLVSRTPAADLPFEGSDDDRRKALVRVLADELHGPKPSSKK